MTKIYFVRHAKPVINEDDRNRPLTEEGLSDTALVLETLKDKKVDAVYCSPYKRSIQTVESVAEHLGLEIVIDERLHERVSGGKWNNQDELIKRWEDFEYHERGGESLGSVQRRNIAALNDILDKHDGESVVIGTHGTALSTIFNYFDPSFGIEDFFRIVGWMPYIVECDFVDGSLVSKRELAYIEKSPPASYIKSDTISFSFLPKEKAGEFFPALFDILYRNMSKIAPSGKTFEEEFSEWYGEVFPAFVNKEPRKIIMIRDGGRLIGFFQYYVNETTFMMEEIQFLPEYQGKGVFQKLYAHLAEIVPDDVPFVEAYAHKNNTKSQGILNHMGLQVIGENKNGNSYHFRGDCKLMFKKYRKN